MVLAQRDFLFLFPDDCTNANEIEMGDVDYVRASPINLLQLYGFKHIVVYLDSKPSPT